MMQVKVEINGVLVGMVSVTNVTGRNRSYYHFQGFCLDGDEVRVGCSESGQWKSMVQHLRVDGAFELAALALRAADKKMKEIEVIKKGSEQHDSEE